VNASRYEQSLQRTLAEHAFSVERRAMLLVVLTLGYYRDMLFPQFGFRAVHRASPAPKA
jgi:hypothetical protein